MEETLLKIIADIAEDDIVFVNKDVNLFETGLIDSMAFIECLVRIEDELGISISPSEIDRKVVCSPNKLIAFVKNRSEK